MNTVSSQMAELIHGNQRFKQNQSTKVEVNKTKKIVK